VAIVFDPHFGEKLRPLAQQMHVWVCDYPENRGAAEQLRQEGGEHSLDRGVTTFTIYPEETHEKLFARILETVDVHHGEYSHSPPWGELRVYGIERAAAINSTLAAYAVTHVEDRDDHFVGSRQLDETGQA